MEDFLLQTRTSLDKNSKIMYNCDSVDVWYFLIYGYYMGISDLADSVFNQCWPGDDSTKNAKYKAFKKELIANPYWKDIQKSNW